MKTRHTTLRERLAALRRDRRGVVALIAAFACIPLFLAAALATDLGLAYVQQTRLRAATDAAALAAAIDLPDATGQATSSEVAQASADAAAALAANGWGSVKPTVTFGNYCADKAMVPIATRFILSGGCTTSSVKPMPAVEVQTSAASDIGLARFVLSHSLSIQARAAAVHQPNLGAFGFGGGLLNIQTANAPLLNWLLGGLLGTNLNLSLISYQGLASVDINALSFLSALAVHVGLGVGSTYNDLATANVTVGDLLSVTESILQQDNAGSVSVESGSNLTSPVDTALSALSSLLGALPTNTVIPLSEIVDLQPYQDLQIAGLGGPSASSNQLVGLNGGINVYGLLAAISSIVGANQTLSLPTDGTFGVTTPKFVTGVTGASFTFKMQVAPPPTYMSLSPAGTTLHSAAMSVVAEAKFSLQNGNSLLSGLTTAINAVSFGIVQLSANVDLPVALEFGQTTATLGQLQCPPRNIAYKGTTTGLMPINVSPGLVAVGLGNFDPTSHGYVTFYTQKNPLDLVSLNLTLLGIPTSVGVDLGLCVQLGGAPCDQSTPATNYSTLAYVQVPQASTTQPYGLVPDIADSNPQQLVTSCGSECLQAPALNTLSSVGSNLASGLYVNIDPSSQVLGLSLGFLSSLLSAIQSGLLSIVGGFLQPILGAVDTVVTNLLGLLGINLGYADVWGLNMQCRAPKLVI